MIRISHYVSSVPMLTRQWLVEGYIWQSAGSIAPLPETAQFIAVLPNARTLIATREPIPPILPGHIFIPWPVDIYSDSNARTPLAVLDNLGHYAQIESFSVPLDDTTNDHADSTDSPSFCRE